VILPSGMYEFLLYLYWLFGLSVTPVGLKEKNNKAYYLILSLWRRQSKGEKSGTTASGDMLKNFLVPKVMRIR
jgi:hypothetical protein